MSNYPPTPKGWLTKRRSDLTIGGFNAEEDLDLPEPYLALLAFEKSVTILIQCGNPTSDDPSQSRFVLYNDISEVVSQIVSPNDIDELWTALSFY